MPLLDELREWMACQPTVSFPCFDQLNSVNCPPWIVCDISQSQHLSSVAKIVAQTNMFPISGSGQQILHLFIDSIVFRTIALLTSHFSDFDLTFGRDVVDSSQTTEKRSRPDFLLWVKNCLMLRGEEEMENFENAKNDLLKKFVWNPVLFGSLPYVFGYAATFTTFQFFALSKSCVLSLPLIFSFLDIIKQERWSICSDSDLKSLEDWKYS